MLSLKLRNICLQLSAISYQEINATYLLLLKAEG